MPQKSGSRTDESTKMSERNESIVSMNAKRSGAELPAVSARFARTTPAERYVYTFMHCQQTSTSVCPARDAFAFVVASCARGRRPTKRAASEEAADEGAERVREKRALLRPVSRGLRTHHSRTRAQPLVVGARGATPKIAGEKAAAGRPHSGARALGRRGGRSRS